MDLRKGIIQGHEAKIYDDNAVLLDETTVYGSNLSVYFDGLNVYSNYSVQVRAFTRKGFGPWGPLVRVSTGAPCKSLERSTKSLQYYFWDVYCVLINIMGDALAQ